MNEKKSAQELEQEYRDKRGWALLGLIFSIPMIVALNGWALKTLWDWIIVPVFTAPTFNIPTAVCIAATVRIFASTIKPSESKLVDKCAEEIWLDLAFAYMKPPVLLIAVWVVMLFA